MEGLARNVYGEMEEDSDNNGLDREAANDIISQLHTSYGDTCTLKKGIKLPKSPLEWSTANDYLNRRYRIAQSAGFKLKY